MSFSVPLVRSTPPGLLNRCLHLTVCLAGLLPASLLAQPGLAAERIYVSYGLLERSIKVSALEDYARTGRIEDEDLAVYAQYAGAQQLQEFRQVLQSKADLSPVAVSQFLYTPQGEILLKRLGQVIQSESRDPGFYAIRAALILASGDPEGLSLLNVLRRFPTRGIRIDVARSLEIAAELEQIVTQTNRATTVITRQADAEIAATNPPIAVEELADLSQNGPYSWQKETITLIDLRRKLPAVEGGDRKFPVDIYLPQFIKSSRIGLRPAPVVVISHGLGSDRTTFAYLAQHLASYGFVVAVPEHPGSNAGQLQALVNGTANEVAAPREFIDRPLDVKFLLDELARRANSDPLFQGRMDLQQVGVLGQSFGGYTALALAGADINFAQLKQDCKDPNLTETLNISLLLQCRAADLPPDSYPVTDSRIKAAIAINPIDSAVFGQESLGRIQAPTMLIAGNADTVAPALPEQIRPFTWLTTPNRYLVLMDRGTHFSTIAGPEPANNSSNEAIPIPAEVIGPDPLLARRYVNVLSTAFFKVYLTNQATFQPYLTATYARYLSQEPMPLNLVRSLETNQLTGQAAVSHRMER